MNWHTGHRLLAATCMIVALTEVLLVLERAAAAIFRAYKFGFDGLSPILLSKDTVIAFVIGAIVFLAVCVLGARVSKNRAPSERRLYSLAALLNILAVATVALLLFSSLARM